MCNVQNEKNAILYYPSIKIEDGAWLRNAILYWDRVSSIVPGFNYNEVNSIEVEYLWSAGIYEPIYPIDMQNDERLCQEFCKQVKKNLKRRRRFSDRQRFSQVHMDKMRMPSENMVHIDKTPKSILDYLLDEGIAKRNCDGPWINMSEQDANIYMATLAKYLARIHGNIEIGTDDSTKFLFPYVAQRSKRKLDKQVYLDIAMQNILPMPNENISIQDIIDFRNQYKPQFRCFRQRLNNFQWSLSVCESVEEIRERIEMLRREIENDINEIEELMCENGIRKRRNALRTLIPIGAEAGVAVLGLMGVLPPMQSIIANAAIGVSAQIFCAEKETEVAEDKAYLFYARKNGIITSNCFSNRKLL